MAYQIDVSRAAVRALKKLEQRAADRIVVAIDALAEDPRPHGVKKLEGVKDLYRIRIGHYRTPSNIHNQRRLATDSTSRDCALREPFHALVVRDVLLRRRHRDHLRDGREGP
jgi:mRNA interferase RelE/StbE